MIYRRFDKFGYEIKGYDYFSVRFLRLFSMPIARRLSTISYPPEKIAAFSLLLGIFSAFLFAFGQRYLTVLAGPLLFISWVLDCVDGDLARLQRRVTYFGGWLDTMAGKLKDIIIFPCICSGVYKQIHSIYIWILGFAIIGSIYFSWTMQTKIKLMRLNKGLPIKTEDKAPKKRRSFLRTIIHETTVGSNLVFYAIILGSFVNRMFWVLLISAIYMCLYSIFTIYVTHKAVVGLDRIK